MNRLDRPIDRPFIFKDYYLRAAADTDADFEQLLALVLGYSLQNIHVTLWTGLAGTLITFLIVVPPWGFYKKAPVQWLQGERSGLAGVGIVVDGKKVN